MASSFRPSDVTFIRTTLGLTQEELAERVGLKRPAITHWENGIRVPSGAARVLLDALKQQAEKRAGKKSSGRR